MLKIRKQAAAMESLQNGSAVTLESLVMRGKRKEIKGKGRRSHLQQEEPRICRVCPPGLYQVDHPGPKHRKTCTKVS